MPDTFYAWSPIRSAKVDKDGNVSPVEVPAGEVVTADKLGLNKEQFQALVDGGSVRTIKYPDIPEGYQDSPVNFMREQAAKAAGDDEAAMLALASDQLGEGTPQASPARPIGG